MQPENLKPIPIPPAQRWREFRVVYLPMLTFLVIMGMIVWLWKGYVQPPTIIGEVETVRAKIIAVVDGTVQELKVGRFDSVTNGQELAIVSSVKHDSLERSEKPVVLRSPVQGFVSVINHLPGESVMAGDPIMVVSAEKSDRIIAWVRQPITVRPRIGDIVEVRRGTFGEVPFEGSVVRVGKQLEEISSGAVQNGTIQRAELGLPLIVRVETKNVDLIPGEATQLRIVKHAASD
jgi:multidrug resistance efflux pump